MVAPHREANTRTMQHFLNAAAKKSAHANTL